MKIFYAVQATGNGHISRAMELLPHLERLGTVDIFLSGDNSHLALDAPIRYRSKGVSLYFNSSGGLDYWKILRGIHPLSLRKEINELPVEKYDLVINDFEFITAAACARKKIPSVQMGHQASFQSRRVPRPVNRDMLGEWVLRNYAKASHYIGLHFDEYDKFILPPVIKKDILESNPADKNYITVYLPAYSWIQLEKLLTPFRDHQFQVFTKEIKQPTRKGHILFLPVSKAAFDQSLVNCTGIITGAGFETPAEALYLGKKLMCIPTRGQYEQRCNAAALEKMGVTCLTKFTADFTTIFYQWLNSQPVKSTYGHIIPRLVDRLLLVQEEMTPSFTSDWFAYAGSGGLASG